MRDDWVSLDNVIRSIVRPAPTRSAPRLLRVTAAIALVLASVPARPHALRVEVLQSIGSLPPHIVGTFEEPVSFQQAASGDYYVLDRRGHAVHVVNAGRTRARVAVRLGPEQGRILQPFGFDMAADGQFVVADAPRGRQRVQTFDAAGEQIGEFFMPGQPAARVEIGTLVINGVGSVRHTGQGVLISHPESGALFTEYSARGFPQRSVGQLRATGFDDERDLHLAMNAGLALVDPTGGYYYVFVTGRPVFRKYDDRGAVAFERHIEGVEVDALLAAQPTRWPRRRIQDREVPLVTPVVRAAAVDSRGHLWISLTTPFTYVYDRQGDKTRTVQFRGAGVIAPTSLSFTRSGRLLVTPGCYEFDPQL